MSFPKVYNYTVKCRMREFQYKSYLAVSKHTGSFKTTDLLDLSNSFLVGTRYMSNIAFPNKKLELEGFNSLKDKHIKKSKIKEYSIKYYEILKRIKKADGPVFVYSNFKNHYGILSFIKCLEAYNYKDFLSNGPGTKRFAIISSDITVDKRTKIVDTFNNYNNKDSGLIKIIIGSPAIKEGISLLRVSQVHILEPYWNESLIEQAVGRAVRYCSHKDLPAKRQKVDVFRYYIVHKNIKETVDQHIKYLANKKNKIINDFTHILKEAAVDCVLNKNVNVYKNDRPIKCYCC